MLVTGRPAASPAHGPRATCGAHRIAVGEGPGDLVFAKQMVILSLSERARFREIAVVTRTARDTEPLFYLTENLKL